MQQHGGGKAGTQAALRIVVAANTTWYVQNFRNTLIGALIGSGHEVTVLAPQDRYVHRITSLGARHLNLELENTGTNPLRELATLLRLVGVLRRERPDLILTYTPKVNIYACLAARLLRIPVLPNISGLGRGFLSGGVLRAVTLQLYRQALTYPGEVFFQNEDDRAAFIGMGLVAPEKTVRLPGSGVDLERFPLLQRPQRKEPVFLMVSRLLEDKGVREFVAAAQRLQKVHPGAQFRLLGPLLGPGPSAITAAELERWQDQGAIRYLGATDDVLPFYADADCIVLPSYREGTPRTLLEGASTGLPIVTTDAVGCRDTVEDGVTGLLCRVADAEDLSDKLEQMILMPPERRSAMGRAGRAKMEREYREQRVIDRYLASVEALRQLGAPDAKE